MKPLNSVIMKEIYQFAVLESIEHLEVTFALTAFKIGHMLPEAIHTSECQEPVRVNLPCVPVDQKLKKETSIIQYSN